MLRTLFVSAIIGFGAIQCFRGPFYILLFYLWIAYFRPEAWLWFDFLASPTLWLIVGVVVLGSTVFSRHGLRASPGRFFMLGFLAETLLSTLWSGAAGYAWSYWQEFAKSIVLSLLIITLVNTERR